MENTFGKNLRDLRIEKRITQSWLAEILDTTKYTVSAWELGKQEPDINTILQIAKFFKVSTDYLLGYEN